MLDLRHTLRRPVQMSPKEPAACCGDLTLTYEQFYERVSRLANGLLGLGLEKGARVAVLALNCHRFLELYYGTLFSGLVIVPLNVRWGAKEFAFALSDCRPKVFALDAVVYEHLKPFVEQLKLLGIEHFLFWGDGEEAPEGMIAYEKLLQSAFPEDPDIKVHEDDLVGLFYTSGTTGNPKGVMLTHKNLMMNAYHAQIAFEFRDERTYLHAAPMFHLADGAATFTVTWNGGIHAFVPRFEPEAVLRAIERYRVTSVTLIPTMINWLLNHPGVEGFDLSSLRKIMYGASPMPVDRLKQAMEVFRDRRGP